tara:strand:- start:97 stop:1353 length:1257 start_codon:yes stop_codon:yes gene_type:complete
MGIKKLNKFWSTFHPESIKREHLGQLRGTTVAIDFNLYLYRFLMGNKNYLKSLFYQVLKLLKFEITPVYIFDGKKPQQKIITLEKRRNRKKNMKSKRDNYQKLLDNLQEYSTDKKINIELIEKKLKDDIKKIDRKLVYIKGEYIEKCKKLLELMKIPYIQAEGEAEHYCSQLNNNNIVDYVLTDDMDVFPCGSLKVIRTFSFNDNNIYIYNNKKFLKKLNITQEKFIKICILFGCDYLDIKLSKDISDLEIYKLVKENDDIDIILSNIINNKNNNIINNKFKEVYNIFDKIAFYKFDIIEKKKIINLIKISYITKNDIELLESFFRNNNIDLSYNKLNSFQQYIKTIQSNNKNHIINKKDKYFNFRSYNKFKSYLPSYNKHFSYFNSNKYNYNNFNYQSKQYNNNNNNNNNNKNYSKI